MMHFVFMERLSKTETYEWIGLLPTPVLRELLRPYVKEFRGEPKTRDGLKRKLEYIEQITAIDPNLFNEYPISESVDKIPAALLHRLAPVLARVKDDIRTQVWGEGVVQEWTRDPYAMKLVELRGVRDQAGNRIVGVSLGSVSETEAEVTWLHGSPRFYGVANTKDLEVIRPMWPWIGARNFVGIPVLFTLVRSRQSFLAAFCPVCATFHMHGAGPGLRVAHCVPSHWDTYVLDQPEYSIVENVHPWELFSRQAREAVEEFLSHIEVLSNEG